jgi:hypothetical protein
LREKLCDKAHAWHSYGSGFDSWPKKIREGEREREREREKKERERERENPEKTFF